MMMWEGILYYLDWFFLIIRCKSSGCEIIMNYDIFLIYILIYSININYYKINIVFIVLIVIK